MTTPVNIPVVSIPKVDHDNLLRMAQEYANLRESLYKGGISPETLEVLIRGEAVPLAPTDGLVDADEPSTPPINPIARPLKTQITLSRPTGGSENSTGSRQPPPITWAEDTVCSKSKSSLFRHQSSAHDDGSFTLDSEKDDGISAQPRSGKRFYARAERRTIIAKNLSKRTTHRDLVDFLRGGLILDIYLRSAERSASISFVEGSAAQDFMNYVKRNDVYMHGKRVDFAWNDRQFILPGHVANKIGIGATRNIVIRGVHRGITEERIREDMDHIHNLVVIDVTFQNRDMYLELNSIHNSLFARTCMISRAAYKGMKIEWYPDECNQPLPKIQYGPRKEGRAPSPGKKPHTAVNRFQMLGTEGTDDGSSGDEEPTVLSGLSSLDVNSPSPWNLRPVAA
ncbi:MAG: hypothetical protein Q9163_004001 [Psora crenata]